MLGSMRCRNVVVSLMVSSAAVFPSGANASPEQDPPKTAGAASPKLWHSRVLRYWEDGEHSRRHISIGRLSWDASFDAGSILRPLQTDTEGMWNIHDGDDDNNNHYCSSVVAEKSPVLQLSLESIQRLRRLPQRLPFINAITSPQTRSSAVMSVATKATATKAMPPPEQPVRTEELFEAVTKPIIPSEHWEMLTGQEFEKEGVVEKLAKNGLRMTTQHDKDPWVEWKPANKDTRNILAQDRGQQLDALREGHVLVFLGQARTEGHGSHLPFVKTVSILPLSPEEMADLLMDSSRVKTYNKMSLGRKDIHIMKKGKSAGGETKIVRNVTQPPIAKKPMLSVTMMHARPLQPQEGLKGYLVVSRAVGGEKYHQDVVSGKMGRSDILMGLNLLQEVDDPDECLATAITHVHTAALPTMLASRLGVSSAVSFVGDIRRLVIPR